MTPLRARFTRKLESPIAHLPAEWLQANLSPTADAVENRISDRPDGQIRTAGFLPVGKPIF